MSDYVKSLWFPGPPIKCQWFAGGWKEGVALIVVSFAVFVGLLHFIKWLQ